LPASEAYSKTRSGPGPRWSGYTLPVPAGPVWPDDPITHDWLAGIADARRAADAVAEPWADAAAGP